jgi:hypothetical protein
LLSDIKIPEVISLRGWIKQVRFGYPKDPLSDVRATRGSITKAVSSPQVDHERLHQRPVRMIEMTVQHEFEL